jgi:hypothetical protein
MLKTYSNYTSEEFGTRDLLRKQFTRFGGHSQLDWKAYRIFKIGNASRNAPGNSHGGIPKRWFKLGWGETFRTQAYRLAMGSPDMCPLLGIKYNYMPRGKGPKPNSISIQHNPDGTIEFMSMQANALIGDRNASTLHRMATIANAEGNYGLGAELRACAQYLATRERRMVA